MGPLPGRTGTLRAMNPRTWLVAGLLTGVIAGVVLLLMVVALGPEPGMTRTTAPTTGPAPTALPYAMPGPSPRSLGDVAGRPCDGRGDQGSMRLAETQPEISLTTGTPRCQSDQLLLSTAIT